MNRVLENVHSPPSLAEQVHAVGDGVMFASDDALYRQPLPGFPVTVSTTTTTQPQNSSSTQFPASNNWLVKQSEIRPHDSSVANLNTSFDANEQSSSNNLSKLQFNPNQGLFNPSQSSYDFQRLQLATQSSGKQIQYHAALARPSMLRRLQIRNQNFTDENIVTF